MIYLRWINHETWQYFDSKKIAFVCTNLWLWLRGTCSFQPALRNILQFQQRIALLCKFVDHGWMHLCTWFAQSIVNGLIRRPRTAINTAMGVMTSSSPAMGDPTAAGMGVYAAQHSLDGGQQAQQDGSYCDYFILCLWGAMWRAGCQAWGRFE